MEQKEWFDRFSNLIDGTVESLHDDKENITGADIGLILRITEDYLDNPEENVGRDLRALELSRTVLDIKYNIDDISWFDIYEIVVELNSEPGRSHNSGGEELEASLEDIYNQLESESEHGEEFNECVMRLFEAVTSEEAEVLQDSDPYNSDSGEFDHFEYGISTKVGFEMGSVEIPNNAQRMMASNKVLEHVRDLDDEDLQWMVRRMRDWIKKYARAEATACNRNLSENELSDFMNAEQTPAEKYWN